jgi:hypothetical protein
LIEFTKKRGDRNLGADDDHELCEWRIHFAKQPVESQHDKQPEGSASQLAYDADAEEGFAGAQVGGGSGGIAAEGAGRGGVRGVAKIPRQAG